MTIETLNLVIAGVHFVREVDGLRRLVALLIAEPAEHGSLPHDRDADDGHDKRNGGCGS